MDYTELHKTLLDDFKVAAKQPSANITQLSEDFVKIVAYKAMAQDLQLNEAILQTTNALRQWATPFDRIQRLDEPLAPNSLRDITEVFEWAGRFNAANMNAKPSNTAQAVIGGINTIAQHASIEVEQPDARVA